MDAIFLAYYHFFSTLIDLVFKLQFDFALQHIQNHLLLLSAPFLVLLVPIFAFKIYKFVFKEDESHGTARFATNREVKEKEILCDFEELGDGVVLGKKDDKYVKNTGHTWLNASTGSGKTSGPVAETVATIETSIVVNDPKGEIYFMCERTRREMGDQVYLADPFKNVSLKSKQTNVVVNRLNTHCYNPLELLDSTSDNAYAKMQALAEAFCIKEGPDDFFSIKARTYIIFTALYLCECRDKGIDIGYPATLPGVRDFLNQQTETLVEHAERMQESDIIAVKNGGLSILTTYADGEGAKTFSCITASIDTYLKVLDDPRIRRFFSKNEIPVHKLHYERMSIFVIPLSESAEQGIQIARIIYADMIQSIKKPHKSLEAVKPMKTNTLFILDEFPQLRKFNEVIEALAIMRGIGGTFFLISQDISQLTKHYGRDGWSTVPGNCSNCFLGALDTETAEYISKLLGTKTEIQDSVDSRGKVSKTPISRALMTPDEIMATGTANPLYFKGHMRPIKLEKLQYFNDRNFDGMIDKNPFEDH